MLIEKNESKSVIKTLELYLWNIKNIISSFLTFYLTLVHLFGKKVIHLTALIVKFAYFLLPGKSLILDKTIGFF